MHLRWLQRLPKSIVRRYADREPDRLPVKVVVVRYDEAGRWWAIVPPTHGRYTSLSLDIVLRQAW